MKPSEVLHTKRDKRVSGMPRHDKGRKSGAPPKRPVLWAPVETVEMPTPVFGAYPVGFLEWALPQLRCSRDEVLHVCSGMLARADGGVRVDIRAAARPDVRADGRSLPFRDASFRSVLIDPPYSVEYAEDLYDGAEYPRPSHLLTEAARVVRPCGRIGFLHYLVPPPPAGCHFEAVRGVTLGCGYRIRAFTVFEREQDSLPLGGSS